MEPTQRQLADLEVKLLEATDQFIANKFAILREPTGTWYHYTSLETLKTIVNSQTFRASFIRATSDPLEFALPLSACRDWACTSKKFFNFQNFPAELFKNFNDQARNAIPRPYFVSFCKEPDSSRLKSCYGDGIVEVITSEDNRPIAFEDFGQLIECKYVADTSKEIFRIMDEWKDKIFYPVVEIVNIKQPEDPAIMPTWFYIFMKLCLTISLAIKQDTYVSEEEVRLVVYSKDPDADHGWHDKRGFRPLSEKDRLYHEYLPLKLNKIGFVASEYST